MTGILKTTAYMYTEDNCIYVHLELINKIFTWNCIVIAALQVQVKPRRGNAQTIRIHYTYITSLKSSSLHDQPLPVFGYFMPLYNRMTAQVLAFLESCDLEWWLSNPHW